MAQIDDDEKTIVSRPSQPKLTAGAARHCPKCGLKVADSTSVCPQDGTQIFDAQEEFLSDKYEFMTVTGSGGMSVVYKARRRSDGQVVAIKMMHSLLMNEQALKRFQQEAKAITSLRHPNIINVHDFGVSEHGQPYMVMDFIDGNTLADVIKEKGGLTVEESLHRFIQLCDALEHAHEMGVLHRDLKPSNIMISSRDGNFADARIVDFGIAKLLDKEDEGNDSGHLTRTGELFGSPLYMSPEQCRGSTVDARTDIYSMGCVMYETMTGRPPLKGASMVETFVLQMSAIPIPLSEACPAKSFPQELETAIAKALAKDPEARFQTMTELEYALMQIQPNQLNKIPARSKGKIQIPVLSKTAMAATIAAIVGFVAGNLLNLAFSQRPEKIEQSGTSSQTEVQKINAKTSDKNIDKNIDLADLAARNRDIKSEMKGGDQTLINALSRGDTGLTKIDLSEAEPKIHDASGVYLGYLKSLKELDLDENLIGDRTLEAIDSLPIVKLELRRTFIDDRGVEDYICHHMGNRLEELALTSCDKLTAKSIGSIAAHLKVLKKLYITYLNIDDQNFAKLKNCALQHLCAEGTAIGDEGVSALGNMTSLTELRLNSTKVGDAGISRLVNLRNLRQLGLAHTNVTDKAASDLAKLEKLQELNLGGTTISEKGLAKLASLKNLTTLYLYETGISDRALTTLGKFENLSTLNLANTNLTDGAIDAICKLRKLTNLDIGGTKITDQGLKKLSALTNLTSLTLYDCPISIDAVRKLQNKNPDLHIRLLYPHKDEGELFWKDPRVFKEYPDS